MVRLKLYLRAAEPPRLLAEGRRGPHRAQLVAPVPDRLERLGVEPHGRRRGCKQVRLHMTMMHIALLISGRQLGHNCAQFYASFRPLSSHAIGGRSGRSLVVVSMERGNGET